MKNFRQQHRPKKSSLIAGRAAVTDALESGRALDRIYINKSIRTEAVERVKYLAAAQHVPVNFVPVEKLNSFNLADHEGLVALISRVQYLELQEVISFVVDSGETPLFLMLDGI